ncbi:MAG: o-succinylbenzoate synthase [Myxococcota bacterium]|nr:o-succinylbenzoate synthase [Myxococcota bacterium]
MKLRAARLTPIAVPMRAALRTTHGTVTDRQGWLLELEAFGGVPGFGEALPLPGFGLESADHAGAALAEAVRRLVGREIDSVAAGLSVVAPDLATAPAARAALDGALRDLEARELGMPLATRLAAELGTETRPTVASGFLLGSDRPDVAAEEAAGAVAAGFRVLKLKVGSAAFDRDRDRVASVRERVGTAVALRVDANEAWPESAAAAHIETLAGLGVELVEQPLDRDATAAAARLRRTSAIPLAADEAVRDVPSAERVLRAGAADVLVVKPAAVGGLGRALAIVQRARAAGIEVLITSFLDTAIGRTGALHLAAALPPSRHASGLATGALLADDLASGAAPHAGAIPVPHDSGLGLVPDREAMARLARGRPIEVTA